MPKKQMIPLSASPLASFLGLPTEIRRIVYSYIFSATEISLCLTSNGVSFMKDYEESIDLSEEEDEEEEDEEEEEGKLPEATYGKNDIRR